MQSCRALEKLEKCVRIQSPPLHCLFNMSIDDTSFRDPSFFKVTLQTPMVVGVAGGPDAGKRDVCKLLTDQLSGKFRAKVAVLSLTDFYRELTPQEREQFNQGKMNLDHPSAFDFDALEKALVSLLAGKPATVPVWDTIRHTSKGSRLIEPVDVILVEGTLVLYPKTLRDLMFMKVFINVDADQRLTRRVTKPDQRLPLKELLNEYVQFVKPMFEDFVLPSKRYADIIIPRGAENTAALQVLGNHLEDHLLSRSRMQESSAGQPPTRSNSEEQNNSEPKPPKLSVSTSFRPAR